MGGRRKCADSELTAFSGNRCWNATRGRAADFRVPVHRGGISGAILAALLYSASPSGGEQAVGIGHQCSAARQSDPQAVLPTLVVDLQDSNPPPRPVESRCVPPQAFDVYDAGQAIRCIEIRSSHSAVVGIIELCGQHGQALFVVDRAMAGTVVNAASDCNRSDTSGKSPAQFRSCRPVSGQQTSPKKPAPSGEFRQRLQCAACCPDRAQKIFRFRFRKNMSSLTYPASSTGAYASSRT